MATTIDQQVALDEALVPSTKRLRIERSNFRLPSDIQSKESTLQVVYDVLRRCPFFQAFLVTADVPEIYMQEFWATAIVHHHSIRFKMNNKKHIINRELFRDMLHVCPRVPGQFVNELPFEVEILEFLRAVINKCLTWKSSGFNSFRLSQAQLLWGLYHSRNIDYAFLIWEDFVYQIEHKKQKKGIEMYYPRFTKVVIHHFLSKDLSIPRRNKINWHYVEDDNIFSTIKVVSRHQDTQQYGAILPIELTNEDIRNITAYKEYYAYATGVAAPKPKASARKKRDEGTGSRPGVPDVPSDDSEEELSWNSFDDEDEEESFDLIPRTREGSEDEGNDEEDQDLRLSEEARIQEEEEADELYRDVDINQGRGLQVTQNIEDSHVTLTPVHLDGLQESSSVSSFVISMLNPISDAGVESIFTTASSSIVSLQTTTHIMTPSTIATITTSSDAPIPPTTIPNTILENLPTFNSVFRFDERLRTSYAIAADLSEMELKKILIEKMEGNKREDDDQEGPFAGSDRGSKRRRKGGEHASASTPSEIATGSAGRSTTGSQSRQLSASESAFAEEPVQTTCQMEEPSHPVFETGADDQPIV
nr:hypothetical protein [Tanacetum cinerariifolium]